MTDQQHPATEPNPVCAGQIYARIEGPTLTATVQFLREINGHSYAMCEMRGEGGQDYGLKPVPPRLLGSEAFRLVGARDA